MTNIDFIIILRGNIATKDLEIKIFDQQNSKNSFQQRF